MYKLLISRLILVSVVAGLVSACAGRQSPWPEQTDFRAVGKLAVRDQGRGQSFSFEWRQTASDYTIEVWGPLGQGRTRLEGDLRRMLIRQGDEVLAAGEPDLLMAQQLGWSVPLASLPGWLRGQPGPAAETIRAGAAGRVELFVEAGWQVQLQYDNSRHCGPRRVVAERQARRLVASVRELEDAQNCE